MYQSNDPAPIYLPVLRSRTSLMARSIGYYTLGCILDLIEVVFNVVWKITKFVVGFFTVVYVFKLLIWAAHTPGAHP